MQSVRHARCSLERKTEKMDATEDAWAPGADYYKGRTAYSEAFFEKLAQALALDSQSTLLDLACGSGELAFGLARYAGKIVGTDKSDAMLKNAASETHPNVTFFQQDLNQGPVSTGMKFDFVTIGRAIPYFELSMLKTTLSLSLKGGGAVVVCGAGMGPETVWLDSYQHIRRRFTVKKTRLDFHGLQAMKSLGFSYVRTIGHAINASYQLDDVINHALSFPTQTASILQNMGAFRAALERALDPFKRSDGSFLCSELSWGHVFRSPSG